MAETKQAILQDTSSVDTILQHISRAERKEIKLSGKPEMLSGGMRRSTWKLTTTHGEDDKPRAYVVSVDQADPPISQAAHKLQADLYKEGASVPRLVGDIGTLASGHQFQVSEFVIGKNAEGGPRSLQDMEAFGVALAKIHRHALSEGNARDQRVEPNQEDASQKQAHEVLRTARSAEDSAVKISQRDGTPIPKAITRMVNGLREAAGGLLGRKLRSGLAHKDAYPHNMIVAKDGHAVMIDLETCGLGLPLHDIAQAIIGICLQRPIQDENGLNIPLDAQAENFLRGYETIKPLSDEERKTLFDLIKIEAQGIAAMSQIHPLKIKPNMTPDDHAQWSDEVGSWVDRVAHSYVGNSNPEKPRR